MQPRLCDNRVGYFSLTVTDYSRPAQRVADDQRCFITRYRLEKKDPSAAISEPVKPIVYYLDANTPEKWRPYLIKAIEDWQPAFEAAGFKQRDRRRRTRRRTIPTGRRKTRATRSCAGSRRRPRTRAVRTSTTRARARSSNAHIQFYHNVQNLARTWYFTQAAANDPRARTFPFPIRSWGGCSSTCWRTKSGTRSASSTT